MEITDIRVQGVTKKVPCASICGRTIIVTGRWLKTAGIKDEDFQEGEIASDADYFIRGVSQHPELSADIFTFSQKLTDLAPRFSFPFELESVAAIPVVSFADWWSNRVSTDLRCDVRKAQKRGIEVRKVAFDDDLIHGIKEIYDETPIRQGRKFWHYNKSLESIRIETETFGDRSEFVGAFAGSELVGFMKVVYVDRIARLLQIVAKESHRAKRPMNAMLAKAVELCEKKRCSHLTYGKYRYEQGEDALTRFKHRNGFEELLVPRYYVPMTVKGHVALRLRLHRGAKGLAPAPVRQRLKAFRSTVYRHLILARWTR